MVKHKKTEDLEQQLGELTLDLQRTRADFENYRKRVEAEKSAARAFGKVEAIRELLPVVDTLDRAVSHFPADLQQHPWATGVKGMAKNIDNMLNKLHLSRISPQPGELFNPELHEAVQFEQGDGNGEQVVSELLQVGYKLNDDVLRPAMVKVTQ